MATGLVVLLAGLSLVGSVCDVITGAPVTAAGRFFELVMMTGATIAGVALVLHSPTASVRRSSPSAQMRRPRWPSCLTCCIRRGKRRGLCPGLLCRTVRGDGCGVRWCRRHHRVSCRTGRGFGCRCGVVRRGGADRIGSAG
ncbi:threonine/serine exporter family protein [Mycobacterium sp.]|uniref:threonine/serine exporter family protein n=1 Tax=Mycobacterium sp. TaxID=1785 RepID=UPI002BFC52C0|nr:hypothetical protein [Mycobacterium sp.]HKP42658.1 hypothetical protein [Mycobacterium sp.]